MQNRKVYERQWYFYAFFAPAFQAAACNMQVQRVKGGKCNECKRQLMDENSCGRQKLFLAVKEARVGFANGLILGILSFVFIGLYLVVLKNQAVTVAFVISACTGIALLLAMILLSLSGTLVPLMFQKLKVDPAVASGPLITTINDLVAVVTYYGLAWILIIKVLRL